MNVNVDGLASAIMEELANYSQDVTEKLKKEVKDAAKLCRSEIQKNAPKDTGTYAKSWKAEVAYENKEDVRVVIHSPKEYRRAHLLEYGHAKAGGGRVDEKPHIRPAEEEAEKLLDKRVKIIVKGE